MNAKMNDKLVMAAAALAVLGSCVNEKAVIERKVAENTIAFRIQDGSTRSSDILVNENVRTNVYPLEAVDNGNIFTLQETVVDLNDWQPATKGTPVYTENVASLYGSMSVAHVAAGASEAAAGTEFSLVKDESYKAGGFWEHTYPRDAVPWNKGTDLYFYLKMPVDMDGAEDMTYGPDGTISFSFTSPETASAQQDIILASTELKYDDYKNEYQEGAKPVPVLFRHALTGVKFATNNYISDDENGTKTYITKVKFTGLKNSGTCTFLPTGDEKTADNITEFSSGGSVKWDYDETTGTFEQVFVDVDNMTDAQIEAFFKQKTFDGTDYTFPTSFYADDAYLKRPSTDWNLNDKNGTMTFWFIPQEITDDVEMEVTFYVQAGQRNKKGVENTVTRTVKFADFVGKVDWKAGQLRTYTLKANEVDVEITDDLKAGVKENLKITNLGNVPQYVRATVIGYWAVKETVTDADGNEIEKDVAVFGYDSDSVESDGKGGYTLKENPKYVDPWSFAVESSASPKYGTMDTFFPSDTSSGWVICNDNYFYFKNIIGVDQAATDVIFKSYTLDESKIPEIYQIDQKTLKLKKMEGVHLIMEVACQAVIAKPDTDAASGYVSWDEAWAGALGYTPVAK